MKQVKSKNRNLMADQTLDDSTSTGIDKRTILSGKPRPRASHWNRFVVNCYVLLCNNFNDTLTRAYARWGLGLNPPLELDILQKFYYLRKEINCFGILFAC